MKKTTIAVLLVLLLASTSIFAVSDNFTVTTTIDEIGLMKITTAALSTHTVAAYNALTDFEELPISSSGAQTFAAYLTTLSNKRTGYTVTMGASAMKSTVGAVDSYIDYTVGVNSVDLTTGGATDPTAVTVLTVASLGTLQAQSHAISLSVDATTFDSAVSGSYSGTVTFTFTAT